MKPIIIGTIITFLGFSALCQSSISTNGSIGITKKSEPNNLLYGPFPYVSWENGNEHTYIALPKYISHQQFDYELYKHKSLSAKQLSYKEGVGATFILKSLDYPWAEFINLKGKAVYGYLNGGTIPGMALLNDITESKKEYMNKTLWLRDNFITQYNDTNGDLSNTTGLKLNPVIVMDVVAGWDEYKPVRFIVKTEDGVVGFKDCSMSGSNAKIDDRYQYSFNYTFFTSDPKKLYNFPQEIWTSIKRSYPTIGMTRQQVLLCWGAPTSTKSTQYGEKTYDIWHYTYGRKSDLTFFNDLLKIID